MRDTLDRVVDLGFKGLEVIMVALLVGMVGMVFFNVVLRYCFDSGISISDEMSRFFFVWLTFVGSVVVYREHSHLGVETLVSVMPTLGRKVFMVLSDGLVLFACAAFFWGTWKFHGINATNLAPITEIPMTYVYNIGYFSSVGIGIMTALRIFRVLTNTIDPREIAIFAGEFESEETAELKRGLE